MMEMKMNELATRVDVPIGNRIEITLRITSDAVCFDRGGPPTHERN